MKTSLKFALLTTVIGTFLCTACGFRIATKHNLGEKYANLVIVGNPHDPLFIELENQLVLNGVNVMYGKKSISYYQSMYLAVLSCGSLRSSQTTVAVGSNSQDLEYTLRSQISWQLFTPHNKPYAIKSSINRAVVSTPGSNLASDSKNALLTKENAVELSREIIDRLHGSYLSLEQLQPQKTTPSASDSNPLTDEHVRVVFNATSGEAPVDSAVVSNEEEAQALIDKRTSTDDKVLKLDKKEEPTPTLKPSHNGNNQPQGAQD